MCQYSFSVHFPTLKVIINLSIKAQLKLYKIIFRTFTTNVSFLPLSHALN